MLGLEEGWGLNRMKKDIKFLGTFYNKDMLGNKEAGDCIDWALNVRLDLMRKNNELELENKLLKFRGWFKRLFNI